MICLALVATSCGNGDTVQETTTSVEPTTTPLTEAPSTVTTEESQQKPPTEVAGVTVTAETTAASSEERRPTTRSVVPTGAEQRHEPPPGVVEQVALAVGAGPGWPGCTASSVPVVQTEDPAHIGWETVICMVGFDLEASIRLRLEGPGGVVVDEVLGNDHIQYESEAIEDTQDAYAYWLRHYPDMPPGRYRATAEQGGVTAETAYLLEPAPGPSFFFDSGSTDREFFDLFAEPGQPVVMHFVGFPPDTPVAVHLYGGRRFGSASRSYLVTLEARTDASGTARIEMPTDETYSHHQFCPVLDDASMTAAWAAPEELSVDERDYFHWCYSYDFYFDWHEWVVVLESLPTGEYTRNQAEDRFEFDRECDDVCVHLVRSDDYASLNPGYWAIFAAGGWHTQAEASAYCERIQQAGRDCYARLLAP